MSIPKRIAILGKKFPNFESEVDAENENNIRIKLLKKYAGKSKKRKEKVMPLIVKLESCSMVTPCGSMACAKCQRYRRLKFIDKWYPYFKTRCDYNMVTLIYYKDTFKNEELNDWEPYLLSQRLKKSLTRIGFDSPVIGGFDMDYHLHTHDVKGSHWMPHYHLLIPNDPEKLKLLRKYMLKNKNLNAREGRKNRPMRIDKIYNVLGALSYCVKGAWLEIPWFINEEGNLKKARCKRRITSNEVYAKSLLVLDRLSESQINFGVNVQKR
ncbi:hypothetical protein B6O77_000865 [Salmonella enterica subsp. enterica serovar Mississippi]|nr:hypothetical protein [Salmonella enterica subsp. enterica serovar Mississippi]